MNVYKAKHRKKPYRLNVDIFSIKGLSSLLIFLGGLGSGFLISQHIPFLPSSPLSQVWSTTPSTEGNAIIRTCFTPDAHCTEDIVQTIQNPHSSIYVQAYDFTSLLIAQALVEAKKK